MEDPNAGTTELPARVLEYSLKPYFRHLNRKWQQSPSSGPARPPSPQNGRRYLLYVHVPFCESLCPFCVFHRVSFRRLRAERYFTALRAEIGRLTDAGFEFGDVYVGGGTPTIAPGELIRTLESVRARHPIDSISVETNPNHLLPATIDALVDIGVDRLSVGVQSFDDELLKRMGRYDSYGSAARIVERLESAVDRFDTLNVDMIFNQPSQSEASLRSDIERLSENRIADQVSWYPIMAPAAGSRGLESMGRITLRNERAMYRVILAEMQSVFRPRTAWSFSRGPSLVDEYLVDHEEFVGVGSGAFSYVSGSFYSSSFSINDYVAAVEAGRTGIVVKRALTEQERLRYRFLVGLFGLELDIGKLRRECGNPVFGPLWKERMFFRLLGSLRRSGDVYRLTERGMYHWVVMMREFLTGVDGFRHAMRQRLREQREVSGLADEAAI